MRRHGRAILVLALFTILSVAYSLVVPAFEAPDEPFHYAFARHIAQGNWLPVQEEGGSGPWQQEGSQAPLYYLVTGWITRPVDQDDFAALAVRNPRANIGDPLNPGNKNFMLYSGRPAPLTGSNLALHLGRWFSTLLGIVTLWFVYLTAALAFPRRRDLPLLAMALVAAVPQFAFLSASFTNDTLVIAASSVTLYWLARLLAKEDADPVAVWEWVVLGTLLGIAALSKLQGLGLIPVAGLVTLFLAWQRRSWRLPLVALLAAGLPLAAIAGWWYWRNIALYDDWTGLGHLMAINGRRDATLRLSDFWPEFRGLRFSAWGLFGWFNILLPDWFYVFADLLTLLGMAGLAGALFILVRSTPAPRWQAPTLRILFLLLTWLVVMATLLAYWISQATGSQGRLLYPAIGAIGILLVLGLDTLAAWLRPLGRRVVWATIFAVLLGMNVFALTRLLPAAYRAPSPVAALPADAQALALSFGDDRSIRLIGLEYGADRYRPGQRMPITLYWQGARLLAHDYQIFIQLLDGRGQTIANLTSHPGWGRNPTTLWDPEAIYADRYDLLVTGPLDGAAPVLARIYTGVIDPATAEGANLPLPAYDRAGAEVTPFVADVVVLPSRWPDLTEYALQPAAAGFGDVIQLTGIASTAHVALEQSRTLTTTLLWQTTATPATDYTAYVHLIDEEGRQVAGFDQAPAAGRFPTRLWRQGDRIVSEFVLDLGPEILPGRYGVWVGLYESDSGGTRRLPVMGSGDLLAGDGEVQIGQVEIR